MTALTRCAVALFVLVSTRLSLPCSFAVGNYNMTDPPERWAHANAYNRRRGPDATHVVSLQGWVFLHNLLSMTGALTYQPFVSQMGMWPACSMARSITTVSLPRCSQATQLRILRMDTPCYPRSPSGGPNSCSTWKARCAPARLTLDPSSSARAVACDLLDSLRDPAVLFQCLLMWSVPYARAVCNRPRRPSTRAGAAVNRRVQHQAALVSLRRQHDTSSLVPGQHAH